MYTVHLGILGMISEFQFDMVISGGKRKTKSRLELTCPPKTGPELCYGFGPIIQRRQIMRKKKHLPEQIIRKLREADILISQGHSVAQAIKALEVSEVTYYRWRKEYGGMNTTQAKRLKELEKENVRLRRAVSDLTLDKLILKEAAKGNF